MFARKVAARLKPNSLMEFSSLMECEILSWLQKQEGFLDLIVLAAPRRHRSRNNQLLGSPTERTSLQLRRLPRSVEDSGKAPGRDSLR
jgi:hypothetical protein